MLKFLLATAIGPTEAEGGGENGAAALPRLDGAGDEAPSVANSLDMVEDG